MPKRKVAQTVIVVRNGQRVKPKIGSIFDFDADEVRKIESTNPDALLKPSEKDFELPVASVQELTQAEREKVRAEVESEMREQIEAEMRAKLAAETKASAGAATSGKKQTAKASADKSAGEDEL